MSAPIEPFAAWQVGSMLNVCNIYRRTRPANSDGRGKPGPGTWSLVVAGQAYQHIATANFSGPSDIGRIVQPSQISVEYGIYPAGVDIEDQDVIRDVTPGGGLFGQVYRILGAATVFDQIPVPEAAYQNVELRQLPKPPQDLPA